VVRALAAAARGAIALHCLAPLTVGVVNPRNVNEGITPMKCAVCEREFAPQRSTRRFCSDRCRLKNHRPNWSESYRKALKFIGDLMHDLEVREAQVERLQLDLAILKLKMEGEQSQARQADPE
jgi:hypothetical protein